MNTHSRQRIYEFDDFRLDAGHLILSRKEREISLPPRAVETLLALIERPGEVVSKDELLDAVWPDTIVDESNLFAYLSQVRKALGNRKDGKPYVETLRRRGYRFICDVKVVAEARLGNTPGTFHLPTNQEISAPTKSSTNGARVVALAEGMHDVLDEGKQEVDKALDVRVTGSSKSQGWRRRTNRFVFAGATFTVLVIAALASGYFYLNNQRQIDSIAVMPFANETGDSERDYLADGMTETLIASLSKMPNLQVKASSSVFRYKGRTDTQTIGKALNTRALLYGRLNQRGDDLILHVELVDVQTENRLWEETYKERLPNLVTLQGDVALDLVRKLSVRLSGADERNLAKNYTESTDAYQLFLQGRFHARKLTQPELTKGIALMQQALDADPSYALAYAGIAEAYVALALVVEMPPGDHLAKAKTAAQKAVEIDDALAEGHTHLGSVFFWHAWNWKQAEEHFRRALELDPNSAAAHFLYADFLSNMGRPAEALTEIKRAREIDPLSPIVNCFEALFLNAAGQPDAALDRARVASDVEPTFFLVHSTPAHIYRGKKMYPESIAEYRLAKKLSPDQTWSDIGLAYSLVESGQLDESRVILNEMLRLSESRWVPPYHIALVYNALGETDAALDWLEKGYEQRDPKIALLKEERWNNLRGDPRFQDLMRRVGF